MDKVYAPTAAVVSVIVPARDAAPTLGRALEALARQNLEAPFEVLVVDDGSTDATAEIARSHAPMVRLVQTGNSRGPGAARNAGVAAAGAPMLAFTDADCFPTPGWLSAGLQALAAADLAQGRVAPDPAAPRTPFDRTVVVDGDEGLYPTANLFVRRELFDLVGGFSDWSLEESKGARRWAPRDRRRSRTVRTPIGEDTLFGWRARRHGATVRFAADALVHHAVVPGGLGDEVFDRWHWARDMPGVVKRVPELRDTFCYRRWFFSRKTARFDAALAGFAFAVGVRRWSAMALVAPYAYWLAVEAGRFESREGARHVAGSVVSDTVTLLALSRGSVRWRCLLV